jgi:hypothetical protein
MRTKGLQPAVAALFACFAAVTPFLFRDRRVPESPPLPTVTWVDVPANQREALQEVVVLLAWVADWERRHFEEQGKYSSGAESLGDRPLPPSATLTLTANGNYVEAWATTQAAPGNACGFWLGKPQQVTHGGLPRAENEGEIRCGAVGPFAAPPLPPPPDELNEPTTVPPAPSAPAPSRPPPGGP